GSAFAFVDPGEGGERQSRAGGGGNDGGGEGFGLGAVAIGQSQDEGEGSLLLEDFADVNAADGSDEGEDIIGGNAEARERGLIHFDAEGGLAGDLVGGDVGGAGNGEEDALNVIADADEFLEVVAVDHDAEIGADAR